MVGSTLVVMVVIGAGEDTGTDIDMGIGMGIIGGIIMDSGRDIMQDVEPVTPQVPGEQRPVPAMPTGTGRMV